MGQITWFRKENLAMPLEAKTDQEAIENLANVLLKNGFVKESYVTAIMSREKKFATGLPTGEIGVAIPHTDARHVLKEGIAVGILPSPVTFCEMASSEFKPVQVRILFMLAVPDKEKVMTVLQQVIGMIQDHDFLKALATTKDRSVVEKLLDARINTSMGAENVEEETKQSSIGTSEITLKITHAVGLHARPASLFVKVAKQFSSDITVLCNGREANAKSILKILALGAGQGTILTLRAKGEDAQEALKELKELVESDFGGVE